MQQQMSSVCLPYSILQSHFVNFGKVKQINAELNEWSAEFSLKITTRNLFIVYLFKYTRFWQNRSAENFPSFGVGYQS